MTVNLNTDTKEDITKLDGTITEIIEKLQLLEDKSKMLNFITISDFAKLRNCSIKTAQDIYNDKTFPSENFGKIKVAEVQAVKKWYEQKRDKNSF